MVSETWRLTENNKRRVEATEMDALRRSSKIWRKGRIRNVTVRQQIGLEETITKEIEQNQLTRYGHVQIMAEGRLPKIALKWMPKQKRALGRLKKNWKERIKKAMNKRNLNEGQWEDRKRWSLGVRQHRKTVETDIHTYINDCLLRRYLVGTKMLIKYVPWWLEGICRLLGRGMRSTPLSLWQEWTWPRCLWSLRCLCWICPPPLLFDL